MAYPCIFNFLLPGIPARLCIIFLFYHLFYLFLLAGKGKAATGPFSGDVPLVNYNLSKWHVDLLTPRASYAPLGMASSLQDDGVSVFYQRVLSLALHR